MQQRTGNKPPAKPPGRVSLPPLVTPPKGSPFEGISKTNAPARDTKIPNLTEHVQVAKARKQALTHGGLLTPAQQKAASDAGKALAAHKQAKKAAAAPSQTPPKPPAANAPGVPTTLPLPTSAPFKVPPPSAPASSPASSSPPGRRGTLGPRAGMASGEASKPKGSLLPGIESIAGNAAHAVINDPLRYAMRLTAPTGALPEGNITQQTAQAGSELGNRISQIGSKSLGHLKALQPGDVVAPAGAATIKKPITPEEFKALEAHGYDLSPRLDKKFTAMALKNGYTQADLDGISGSAKIDKAFSKPPNLALRILGGAASDIAGFGTLPAGLEGAARETAGGHCGKVVQALVGGLTSSLPVIGNHPFVDELVAHPFNTATQFAGAGKFVGEAGRLGGLGRAVREVESANSGLKLARGNLDKNAYTATGQVINDALTNRVPALSRRAEGKVVDTVVERLSNRIIPGYVKVQRAYAHALDKTGRKRAEELLAAQQSGGKPEQIAAFFRSQGNEANAKFYDRVAATTKTLTPADHALLNAHAKLAAHTSAAKVVAGKFGDTAATFRRYSQLIRSGAHLGDPEAQRILGLREDYQKSFGKVTPEETAALEGAYSHAVDQFAARHTAAGHPEPAYVAYGKAKPLIASPFTPSAGGPTAFKDIRGRQKAETGATFESGKYLVDANSPLVDSIRAQREHLASVLKQEVADAVGQHATGGDVVPPGHVFVPETNLRTVRKTTSDMEDNPVSSTDYYAEDHSFRQQIHDALSKNTKPTGHRVPSGEKGYFIPTGSHARILDHTRPPSRSAYMRAMGQYQRLLVSYRPSTIVNNTIGSLPLAATGGAGPVAFKRAAEAMRNPELAPAVARGHGLAGSFGQSRSRVGTGLDFMRAQSAKGEDFSRLATFFASKEAKQGAIAKRAKALEMDTNEYQKKWVAGEIDQEALDSALNHMKAFTGEMLKPNGPLARKLGGVVLFHNWLGHIAKLMLVTLPVNHPRRLAVLQTLSAYGNAYRQQNGVWPDWYAEYLPLFQHVERIGKTGLPQTFTKTFSTAGVNPFSTLNNFANPVSLSGLQGQSAANAAKGLALGVAAPPIQVLGNTIFNRPSDSTDAGRYLLGQTMRQIPGVSIVRPQGGMASDSIPFVSEQKKKYSSGRKGHPLPWDFRASARPEGGILGDLLRYGLGSISDVPAQGPIHQIDQGKHIGAAAKAARKH